MVSHSAAHKARQDYQRALQELGTGNVLGALARLEAALRHEDNPDWHSLLGFCIAKERGHISRGMALCQAALARQPDCPDHYYYLARVLLVAKQKPEAIQVLRDGLAHADSAAIRQLLDELGLRKSPLIPWLPRDNPLNKYLGILLHRIGLR